MIQGLIFDFDGLLVDTESAGFESWRIMYADYGHELTLELYQHTLGTFHGFDPLAHLETLLGRPLDRTSDLERRNALKAAMSADQPLLPGVLSLLAQARARGMPCAVASSSHREWVEGWLERHAIRSEFVCVRTADDVVMTKPAPDLFLSAAAGMGLVPANCLVFEDSPNGIRAAHAAGMRCVAVPGAVTSQLQLPPSDLTIASLDALTLDEMIARLGG